MLEKEKMLVTSVFSFSHNVYKRLLPKGCKNMCLFSKGLEYTMNGAMGKVFEQIYASPCFYLSSLQVI